MKVGIIGAGNVATHLVKGFLAAGIEVPVVYSRTLASAQELANLSPSTKATASLNFQELPHADVYLIAVPDQALPELVPQFKFPEGVVVAHTSGTQPLEILQALSKGSAGVFYPVQTFSKEKEVDWRRVPICVEGSSPEAEETLLKLGQRQSDQVVVMAGPARRQLHLAAVFACNFTNHLWGIAQEVLQQAHLPASLLEPLVEETMRKAFLFPPFQVQTGPAQRGDTSTLEAHLKLLENLPQYQELYKTLTTSIQAAAKKK
ncbi:hypothetical protein TH63_00525 [Rufibacter radiotolerans]|uniref:DUF2520 domain-containing protein n=1 Tax=Rufibacter radiotolerans TaxID=1379910 RepID=A0A0H4VKP8_9BACT|nr:Rossmann-like and DUF2520 domain-containing protein [Rufibacter radiotolerans]AKQ44462.1 hypothetical protein TH63_00525 [Rufibacter radiotolerans]